MGGSAGDKSGVEDRGSDSLRGKKNRRRKYIIDPQVRGRVEMINPKGLSGKELQEALDLSLQVNGLQSRQGRRLYQDYHR